MIDFLIRFVTGLFWRRLDRKHPPRGPVLVTWENARGARARIAVWYDGRLVGEEDAGPGFVCYYTGVVLADSAARWMPIPATRRPKERA